MTWHTPLGVRVLAGPEADLFRDALMTITDWIVDDVDQVEALHEFGLPAFDSATARGKLAVLAEVGHALLFETDVCPELTAVNESAIGAIFVALEQSVEHEIDIEFDFTDVDLENVDLGNVALEDGDPEDSDWKDGAEDDDWTDDGAEDGDWKDGGAEDGDWKDDKLWRRQILETICVIDPELELPDVECNDSDEWSCLIDVLRDRILWDHDFSAEPAFGDADPVKAQDARSMLGIDQNYFRAVAPDPSDEELAAIRLKLRLLQD